MYWWRLSWVGCARPCTTVLAVRVFGGRGNFRALTVLTLATNTGRAKSVLARIVPSAPAVFTALPDTLATLEAHIPLLRSDYVRLLAAPVAFIQLLPRVLAVAAPGILRSIQFYGHLAPVVAGYLKCLLFDSKRRHFTEEALQVRRCKSRPVEPHVEIS